MCSAGMNFPKVAGFWYFLKRGDGVSQLTHSAEYQMQYFSSGIAAV